MSKSMRSYFSMQQQGLERNGRLQQHEHERALQGMAQVLFPYQIVRDESAGKM